jgi:hypothetical protein
MTTTENAQMAAAVRPPPRIIPRTAGINSSTKLKWLRQRPPVNPIAARITIRFHLYRGVKRVSQILTSKKHEEIENDPAAKRRNQQPQVPKMLSPKKK